jgi:hypothetical protein
MTFYLEWAQAFGQLDTKVFLATGHTLSPMGVPLTQWSHGPGLVLSVVAAISGQFNQPDAAVLWIGRGLIVVFWWAMFTLLRQAAYGDVQRAVYGVLVGILGTHLGFYSRSFSSETLSQTFLAVMSVWVLTRRRWRILDTLVVGCLAGLLVITRWQLLIYVIPLFGVMYYHIWKARGEQSSWMTLLLVATPLIPLFAGLAQIGLTNRWMTGDFLRSPYSFGAGTFRSLDFTHPELAAILFHPWHGLLSYHPLYLLGFIALVLLIFQSRSRAEGLFYIGYVLVIVAHVYLQAAWYAWWLGSLTFGMRGLSIAAVVLVPAIVRFMREREGRKKSNTLFGTLVLAACLWSTPLLLANLRSETEFTTYSALFGSYANLARALLPALLVLGLTLVPVLSIKRVTTNRFLRRLHEAVTSSVHKRPILSISLLILLPIGLYGLIAYTLSKYSGRFGLNTEFPAYLALVTIPLGVVLAGLLLGVPISHRGGDDSSSEATVNGQHDLRTSRPKMLTFERVAAYLLICLFILANAVFVRLASRIEDQISTDSAPTDGVQYVSPVRIDEVESSYCEYLSVPGFEGKKAALEAFLERLKACTAIGSATAKLPQCTDVPEVTRSVAVSFEPFLGINSVTISGAGDTDRGNAFHGGDVVGVTTYWTPLKDTRPLKFSQRLQDSSGRQWVLIDYWPRDGRIACELTDSWQRDEAHADRQSIGLPPDLPPGKYEISLVVYDPETGAAVLTGEKPSARLAEINVVTAASPPDPDSLGIPVRLDVPLSDELALLGYGVEPNPLQPESDAMLRVWWTALRPPTQPYRVLIELVDSTGHAVSSSLQPLSSAPPDTWQEGQIVGERYPIALDPAVGSGDYRLRVSLVAPGGAAATQAVEIGTVPVLSRPRMYELPPVEHPLNMKLGQDIALRGYTLDRPAEAGNELRLTLYWQASQRVTGRYNVFLHVVDDSGHIVAQQDNEPDGGAAPTQSWLEGEVVGDTHVFNVPGGGPYTLLTGLYDPETGQRLPVWDESQQPVPDSAIPLERVSVP